MPSPLASSSALANACTGVSLRRVAASRSPSAAATATAAKPSLLVPLPSRRAAASPPSAKLRPLVPPLRRVSPLPRSPAPPPRAATDADEEIIPLLRPPPTSFTDAQLEQLKHPHLLRPGSTVREELEALREAYVGAEEKALRGEEKLFSKNWDGDVYVGSRWNVATILALVSAATTLGGLAFAMATKGVLWATVDYYGM